MMLFRNAKESDLSAIHLLAEHSGIGITTLAKDTEVLRERIASSVASFAKNNVSPINEYYLFVLEDTENSKIVGTSAIEALIGHDRPFYSYKISKRTLFSPTLNVRNDDEILTLVNDYHDNSEICTLFLEPAYRRNHHGLLLSRARFLFMKLFPQRFAKTIIADMRGVSNENGDSPFWDSLGVHFFKMPFSQADQYTLSTDKQFIADLMPTHPIYVKLLSPEAQAVIGIPHPATLAAMNILLKEGFVFNNYIDIFDGGPTLECPLNKISTITSSKVLAIKHIREDIHSSLYIIANTKCEYRATIAPIIIDEQKNHCTINSETAELLQLTQNDHLCITPIRISHE